MACRYVIGMLIENDYHLGLTGLGVVKMQQNCDIYILGRGVLYVLGLFAPRAWRVLGLKTMAGGTTP